MASAQTAYRNSDGVQSTKTALRAVSPKVLRIIRSSLPSNLRMTLAAMVEASGQGPDLWASTFSISIEAGGKECRHSYKTVQRHIDRLERLQILKIKHEANRYVPGFGMRRSATYVLQEDALRQRQSYRQWREEHRRNAPRRGPRPVPREDPPAPAPQPAEDPHRSTARQARKLSSRDARALVTRMTEYMRGYTRHADGTGLAFNLDPSDPRYRAPQSQENALISACMVLGIPEQDALEHLKLCRWEFPPGKET